MRSFVSAIGLLTIIPVPYRWAKNISGTSLYFSLAGAFIGLIYYGCAKFILLVGISVSWSSFIIICVQVILTRAFHIDGLADMVDGFWGGRNKEHRLRIMKDSSIGVFGTISVILLFLGKWIAMEGVFENKTLTVFIISSMISRFSMTVLSGLFSYSRKEGTGSEVVASTGILQVVVSLVYTIVLLVMCFGTGTLLLIFGGISFALFMGFLSYVKIEGITGDVLGASCEVVEFFVILFSMYFMKKFPLFFHSVSFFS